MLTPCCLATPVIHLRVTTSSKSVVERIADQRYPILGNARHIARMIPPSTAPQHIFQLIDIIMSAKTKEAMNSPR
jgi:hypothetical protein